MPDTPTLKPPPPKPHPLNYAPPLPLRERLGRHLPSAEQFVNFLKNLVWVAPLTLLIWVYAEREQSVTLPNVIVPIEVLTTDHNRIVNLRLPNDGMVVLELSGPRTRLDRVHDLLKPKPDGAATLQIFIDPQIKTGGQNLPTLGQINNNPVFKNNGITVKSAQPPYLSVDIDEFMERDVPVRPPPDVAGLLSEQTRFAPDTVKLRAPKEVLAAAEAKGPLFVYADLSKREELKTRTGPVKLENVPVYWGNQRENVHIAPVTVVANLDIRPRDVTFEIGSVPIYQETPAGLNERFVVQYKTPITNVVVTGPSEQIELIKKGEFKPKARLEISSFDEPNKSLRRALKYVLPPGVAPTPETTARSEWEFSLEPR